MKLSPKFLLILKCWILFLSVTCYRLIPSQWSWDRRWQTTEGSPSLTWQAGGGSFLLQPRRYALSSCWLWTFNHNTLKLHGRSSRSSYQFSLPATSLSRLVAVCAALVCGGQCSMPVRLGHWQSQTSKVCSGMTGQWSDRSAMSSHKTLSPPDPMSYLHGLALKIWSSFWKRRLDWYGHVELSSGAVKTAFDIQVDGKCGRPKMIWKQLTERDCREWNLQAIDPHDRHTWRSGAPVPVYVGPPYSLVDRNFDS